MKLRHMACSLLIGSALLSTAACTETTPQQHAVEPGDNGAFCSGTPQNQKDCENNQSRMTDPAP